MIYLIVTRCITLRHVYRMSQAERRNRERLAETISAPDREP
jgi:hypothetical protein